MYEEMIVSGAWWDYVDEIAIQRLSKILVNDRASMERLMREWSMGEHIWKRRCSILIQNRSKGGINLELLYDCIRPSFEFEGILPSQGDRMGSKRACLD